MKNEILLIQITLFCQTTEISWAVENAFRDLVDEEELVKMVREARGFLQNTNNNITAWNYFIL